MNKPLSVYRPALEQSAINLEAISEDLSRLHSLGGGSGSDHTAAELPLGALGLVGELARRRYNDGFKKFRQRLDDGATSAANLSSTVRVNEQGYAQAEHKSLQAVLRGDDQAYAPRDDTMVSDFTDANHEQHRSLNRNWVHSLGMGFVGGVAMIPISSRAAATSLRTLTLLKIAAGMTYTSIVGIVHWLSVVVPSDEPLNQHIAYWSNIAGALDEGFSSGDPTGRQALASAWSGDTMDVADRVLRDFVTAGTQLSDEAVARGHDLVQAVESLNSLHDWAYAAILLEINALIAVRALYPVNPAAALTMGELIGRKVIFLVAFVHGSLAAQTGIALHRDMDGQPTQPGPGNVPSVDFPLV